MTGPDRVEIVPMKADYFDRDDGGRERYTPTEYYVYVNDKLVRVCPSEGMANEVAAAYA